MALDHATQGQPVDVRPYGSAIGQAQSVALFKSSGLEVMRLVLPAGHAMPEHKVTGEITIHCLEGVVDVDVGGAVTPLAAGHLLYVEGGVPHALLARQAASVLVTIALAVA
ncbi:MAG: cupin domain-containing protein [Pseudomonadota bacterium]|nr:cupin domain-containing protein [Pseudomonadota bacterium]